MHSNANADRVNPQTTPSTIKAITILEPWASLIALGVKRIETRSWHTPHRGPIAIHAGKNPKMAREFYEDDPEWWDELGLPALDALPYGCVVATAHLRYCKQFEPGITASINQHLGYSSWETSLGDFTPGRYGWVLDSVNALPEPIPARGQQGLWDWMVRS